MTTPTIGAMLAEARLVTDQVGRNTERHHFVVVYSFARVGSTSITRSLANLEGVHALQAHFLGRKSLSETLDLLLDPAEAEYPQLHTIGQLVGNVAISREIEAFRRGMREGAELSIITPVRHPIDRWRSAITQDIEWHLALLRALSLEATDEIDDEDAIESGLPILVDAIASVLERSGGIDAFLAHRGDAHELNHLPSERGLQRAFEGMLTIFLRPFAWLDDHFSPFLDVGIEQMEVMLPYLLRAAFGWGNAYLLRYEDLYPSMSVIVRHMGVEAAFSLRHENASAGKEFADVINASFQAPEIERLRALSASTWYCRRFGYD